MKTKILLSSLALAGLAMAQPVSAATRSANSLPQVGAPATSAERAGSIYGEAEEIGSSPLLIVFLLFAVVGGIIIATSGSKSPG